MRLWSGRPRYANLSPDQPLSPTSPARPAQEGSSGSEAPSNVASPRPARPRASTLDRIRERKVAFETDDHESLLGADGDGEDHQSGRQTTSRRDRKSFKPSLPSLPSTKRLSFSLDSIHPKAKSKATSGLSKPEATATTDPKVSIKSAKPAHSKATKQAETVLCLIAGQDVIANGSVEKGRSQQPKAVSTKDMKELKSLCRLHLGFAGDAKTPKPPGALTRPKDATKIIDELKKIPVPDDAHAEAERSLHSGHARTRGACLDCPEAEAIEITQSTAVAHSAEPSSDLESSELATTTMSMKERLNQLAGSGIPSAGRVLGQMATSAGAFEALAGVTGRMIDSSGAHDGIVKPPDDRMSVLVYW